jgi:cis-L-3-hydroxyproline dehydratase
MKLRELRAYSVPLSLATGAYEMSHGRRLTAIETTVVQVTADDGTVGHGEACTLGASYIEGFAASVQAAVRELAPVVLDCDIFGVDVMLARLDTAMRGHRPAKAAIDAALWDLRGKLLGLPVYQLLGGLHQESYRIFHPLTLATPKQMADEAETMAARGYRSWQLKLGNDPLDDAKRVHAVLDVLEGRMDFVTSDANRGWTMGQAFRFLAAIQGRDTYVEQPCNTLDEVRQVRERSTHPITADEVIVDVSDMLRCIATSAADAVNIKPARVGGLTRAAQMRDLAVAAGMMIMIDEPMGGDLATAGISHLSASCRPDSFLAASQVTETHITAAGGRPLARSGTPTMRDGLAHVSTGAGLGIDVDPEALGEALFVVKP